VNRSSAAYVNRKVRTPRPPCAVEEQEIKWTHPYCPPRKALVAPQLARAEIRNFEPEFADQLMGETLAIRA
jgi:hypothetical protein